MKALYIAKAIFFPLFIASIGFSINYNQQPRDGLQAIAASLFIPVATGSLWLMLSLVFHLTELTKQRQDAQEARIKALEDALANE